MYAIVNKTSHNEPFNTEGNVEQIYLEKNNETLCIAKRATVNYVLNRQIPHDRIMDDEKQEKKNDKKCPETTRILMCNINDNQDFVSLRQSIIS